MGYRHDPVLDLQMSYLYGGEQMLKIAERYDVVLTVHDAVACLVPEAEVKEAQKYVEECMRWTPDWAEGLPVNCESGYGRSYGDC